MPRPGPRPYECVRRAWHSERHQPIRGSLIKEIFRVASEIHSPATRKNKEWQEKLPVVVLKAEEIMYSKANSEAEYMDLATLLDRTNDAINTIIRLDESTETGELLRPCIEAALTLGCIPIRASRSQRNNAPGYYLSSSAQDSKAVPVPHNVVTKSNLGNRTITSDHISLYQNLFRSESISCVKNSNTMTSEKGIHSNRISNGSHSVYPLYYGNCPQAKRPPCSFSAILGSNHGKVDGGEKDFLQSCSPGKMDSSNKVKFTEPKDTSEARPEIKCDLSLRLGPHSFPHEEVNNISSSETTNAKQFGNPRPQTHRDQFLYFPSTTPGQIHHLSAYSIADENARKRKPVCSRYAADQRFWQHKLPYSHLNGTTRNSGS